MFILLIMHVFSFKLQKFNLYREEPEGFAELIDLLDQASSTNYAIVSEKIMELAGIALLLVISIAGFFSIVPGTFRSNICRAIGPVPF